MQILLLVRIDLIYFNLHPLFVDQFDVHFYFISSFYVLSFQRIDCRSMFGGLLLCFCQLHLSHAHLLFHVHLKTTLVEHVDAIRVLIRAGCNREVCTLVHTDVIIDISHRVLARLILQCMMNFGEVQVGGERVNRSIVSFFCWNLVQRLRVYLVQHMPSISTWHRLLLLINANHFHILGWALLLQTNLLSQLK